MADLALKGEVRAGVPSSPSARLNTPRMAIATLLGPHIQLQISPARSKK
eukprot:CAMPEP_0182545362 /NCGR_PEP_ID=MMETSP1323-20130603/34460_1 /TAXON_ID=236787 /ORGANISM="Florenciella parvula, Strain RCC1693" /LENGTH=48 /DNA_ID= /DNA_START= /DNA_END= /DNA_ORIENTATION=